MGSLRTLARRGAEALLHRSGAARLARRVSAGRTLVLAWHNIVPHGELVRGDASLHLPQRAFARQLDVLQRTHDVIPLADLFEPAPAGSRPRVVITLDDATAGALTAGVAELVLRRLPATLFVAPGFVPGGTFWWDAVRDLDERVREHALTALRGADDAVRAWAGRTGHALQDVPAHQRCGTEAQLAAAAAAGVSFAPHSWSHRNLATLTEPELQRELREPLAWLRSRFTAVLPWLAFPYGRCSPLVMRVAAECGYEGALRIRGGWIPAATPAGSDRFALPRLNVPAGVSPDGFLLRVSGLLRR